MTQSGSAAADASHEATADATADEDPLADVPPTDEHPVLLFDGVCNLCDSLVQFTIPRDGDATFRFASLQSPVGQALLDEYGLPTDDFDTFVLVEDGAAHTKSEAALRASRHFDGLYPLARFFLVVPRPVRDRIYDFVAARRYDWFGQKGACMLPSEGVPASATSGGSPDESGGVRERFLDDGMGPSDETRG